MAPMQPNKPSFTIVVSEKGGAERRETFTTFELGIGRVQGNDLTLVKGNVSKQHARISYRDGIFVVADLNSTNGTYVNRRKIQEPTNVGEGDRVYIGDFILRIESVEHPAAQPVVMSAPAELPDGNADSRSIPDSTTTKGKIPNELTGQRSAIHGEALAAPKVPGHAAAMASWSDNSAGRLTYPNEELQAAARASVSEQAGIIPPALTLAPGERDINGLVALIVEPVVEQLGDRWPSGLVESEQQPAVDRAIDDQIQRLVLNGTLAPTIQTEHLLAIARAEVTGLGPVGRYLDDPSVTEILIPRSEQVLLRRNGNLEALDYGISSRRSLRRIILRLCNRIGAPVQGDELTIERPLPAGGLLWAVLPPLAIGQPSLVLRKTRENAGSLQSLVRAGVISRAMSVFLHQAIAARARIVLVGPREADVGVVASALLSSATEGTAAILEGTVELGAVSLSIPTFRWSLTSAADVKKLVMSAARLSTQQFGVSLDSGRVTAAVVDALGASAVGVVAIREARTAEHALSQMTAELLTQHPGITVDTARRLLAGSFDFVLEVVRYRDGRQRLIRIGEMGRVLADEIELDDIFTFVATAGIAGELVEGTFRSSGTVPRAVEEAITRGAHFDTNVFARPVQR